MVEEGRAEVAESASAFLVSDVETCGEDIRPRAETPRKEPTGDLSREMVTVRERKEARRGKIPLGGRPIELVEASMVFLVGLVVRPLEVLERTRFGSRR